MRPTRFAGVSPKNVTGELRYSSIKHDGTVLDMNYKSISEQRRDLLYLTKLGYSIDKDLRHFGTSQSKSPARS